MITSSTCLTASGLTESQSVLSRTLSKGLLNTEHPGASQGSPFQGLATLSVKKLFPVSSLEGPSSQGRSPHCCPQPVGGLRG